MRHADRDERPKIRELAPGQVVGGKYRIERQLGAGGMGVVFAASDVQLRRKVAIKAMAPALAADDGSVKRFLREARAVVCLTGEHTVRVFDVGELASGIPYIAMEFLVGTDLDSLLAERGRLPFREAVDLLLQAMSGIAEAHAAGIVHRDLKPANLFLTRRSDGTPLVKVLDFGLAKATEQLDETKLTGTNTVMGTQHYMSPEQLRGSRDVNARTDIWALGVCLYQLTTGLLPFEPPLHGGRRLPQMAALGEISRRICSESPRPPHEVVSEIPFGLSQVMMRCLEKDAARRFGNVADLGTELETFASPEFIGFGARLETVLEGQTLMREVELARSQLADDTIPESSSERTTEKMERGAGKRALAAILQLLRAIAAGARGLRRGKARALLSKLGCDRRSVFMLGLTAFFLTLVTILIVVVLISRDKRTETTTTTDPMAGSSVPTPHVAETGAAPASSSGPTAPADLETEPPSASATAAGNGAAEDAREEPSRARTDVGPSLPPSSQAHATPPRASSRPATAATVASSRNTNCTPPYVKQPDGKIVWKLECLH